LFFGKAEHSTKDSNSAKPSPFQPQNSLPLEKEGNLIGSQIENSATLQTQPVASLPETQIDCVQNTFDSVLQFSELSTFQPQNVPESQPSKLAKLDLTKSLPKLNLNQSTNKPQWVLDSLEAISAGHIELSPHGVGGTYFVKKDGNSISILKPVDEEPGAPLSPKKTSTKPLLPWGGGAIREVAAYLLDKGAAGVPETYMIEYFQGTILKKGSLQRFVPNDGDCVDISSSKFNIDDVHRIGILDLRILNMDRNDENMLIQKRNQEMRLIPIDHSYSFPDQISPFFEWQFWKQAKEPFSQNTLDIIESIDVISDARLLLELGLSYDSLRLSVASTILLQQSSKKGLSLFAIASLVSGPNKDFEKLLTQSKSKEQEFEIDPLSQIISFVEVFSTVVDNYLVHKL